MKNIIILTIALSSFTSYASCLKQLNSLTVVSSQIGQISSELENSTDIALSQYLLNLKQQLAITQQEVKQDIIVNCFLYNQE